MASLFRSLLKRFSKRVSAKRAVEPSATPNVDALKQWTGKANVTILYDSTVDEFTKQGLFDKVVEKPNIAIVPFTDEGDVFGVYSNVGARSEEVPFEDPDMFIFSFQSHWIWGTPKRFLATEEGRQDLFVLFLPDNSNGVFVQFASHRRNDLLPLALLGHEKSRTRCDGVWYSEQHLRGYLHAEEDRFSCARVVAVQLE